MESHWRVQYRRYARPFKQPLQTHHGPWTVREGILLRLTDLQLPQGQGQIGFGEIAPIPWFGSETLDQAWDFCQHWPQGIDSAAIAAIPNSLPACQFGFESAIAPPPVSSPQPLPHSALLPAGVAALDAWRSLWPAGFRTFKWKIGVLDCGTELAILQQLRQDLPPAARLRLDANGGLSLDDTHAYLTLCDLLESDRLGGDRSGAGEGGEAIEGAIEFLEQPLPPSEFAAMQTLAQQYQTPLALDESVATLPDLQRYYQRGWRGLFVVKPAIAGSPTQLRQICQTHDLDVVFSSALETAVGRAAGLQLAAELARGDRAQGYGTTHWFQDQDQDIEDFEQLWQSLA